MHGTISPRAVDVAIVGRLSASLADFGSKAAHHIVAANGELSMCQECKLKERRHDMPALKKSEAVVSTNPVIQPKPSPIRSLRSLSLETILAPD